MNFFYVTAGHVLASVPNPGTNPASGTVDITGITISVVPLLYTVGLIGLFCSVLFVRANRTASKSAELLMVGLIAGIIGAMAFFAGVLLQFGGGIINLITGGGA